MGPILNRYVFRETAQTWLAVTGVLLLVLLTDQFARVLDDAAGAELPKNAIFAVMGLSSIQYLTILIPVAIFLSIILALARMYKDSEMAALMACGVGNTAFYRPILLLALVLAALVGWLSLEAGPAAQRQVLKIFDEAKKTADLAMLEPGRFIAFGKQKAIVYAERVSPEGNLSNVFVQLRDADEVTVIVAEEAGQRSDPENGRKVLTFYRGQRYEGVPGSREFKIMRFTEHGIPFEAKPVRAGDVGPEAQTLVELLAADTPAAMAELQWRASVPLTLLVLCLIAVPLSRSQPRQGRYANLAVAILIYITYANLLGAARVWVEKGQVDPWLGLWWVHAGFLLLGLSLLQFQNRYLQRWWSRDKLVKPDRAGATPP
jgi:lipopolysaccharide export system permease protein